MLSYFNGLFGGHDGVIGLDFGSRVLKAVQVSAGRGGLGLVAAAKLHVPAAAREDAAALREFFRGPVRRLVRSGGFSGRKVAVALPARDMFACSRRQAEFGAGAEEAYDAEAAQWLPFPAAQAVLRHVDAGDVCEGGAPLREVVTLAVRKAVVERFVGAASGAGLQVVSVVPEPDALLRALGYAYGPDARMMRLIVDLGYDGTRVYAGIGRRLMFARCLPAGGRLLERAVANAVGVAPTDSCALRTQLPPLEAAGGRPEDARLRRVDEACDDGIARLGAELRLCHHYLSSTFRATPVHHVVFVGGGARHRRLCQRLAGEVGLPFRSADPLSRLAPSIGRANAADVCGQTSVTAFGLSLEHAGDDHVAEAGGVHGSILPALRSAVPRYAGAGGW